MYKTNPNYYKGNGYDVLDVITHFSLNFQRGNVLKYVCRAGKKDKRSELEDLKKAATYLNREICRLEAIYERDTLVHFNKQKEVYGCVNKK